MHAEWSLTGHDEMDRQHAVLFALVGRARRFTRMADRVVLVPDMPEQQVRELSFVVADLTKYIVEHFAYEERLMAESGYAGAERHCASHRAISSSILQLIEALDAGQSPARLLDSVLDGWLRHHIGNIDRALAEFLRDKQRPTFPTEPSSAYVLAHRPASG